MKRIDNMKNNRINNKPSEIPKFLAKIKNPGKQATLKFIAIRKPITAIILNFVEQLFIENLKLFLILFILSSLKNILNIRKFMKVIIAAI